MAVVDGKLYLFGGGNSEGAALKAYSSKKYFSVFDIL
jgi:hypothetical protein